MKKVTYQSSGVNISAGEEAVERIKKDVESTKIAGVLSSIGNFGGFFELSHLNLKEPVLVSSTDGVGTKAHIAAISSHFDTIGIDLVAMCVDDIVCSGAKPLFFLDYISVGKLVPENIAEIVSGISKGCKIANTALIGGEMAEHANLIEESSFDLAGFVVGVVEKSEILGQDRVTRGDMLIGLNSPGLRSNGYTLARHILFDICKLNMDQSLWEGGPKVVDALLEPSVIYAPNVLKAIESVNKVDSKDKGIKAIAHITGGGLVKNLLRVIPSHLSLNIDFSSWEIPRIFNELQRLGRIETEEMRQVFNLGIGMVLVVNKKSVSEILEIMAPNMVTVIGEII